MPRRMWRTIRFALILTVTVPNIVDASIRIPESVEDSLVSACSHPTVARWLDLQGAVPLKRALTSLQRTDGYGVIFSARDADTLRSVLRRGLRLLLPLTWVGVDGPAGAAITVVCALVAAPNIRLEIRLDASLAKRGETDSLTIRILRGLDPDWLLVTLYHELGHAWMNSGLARGSWFKTRVGTRTMATDLDNVMRQGLALSRGRKILCQRNDAEDAHWAVPLYPPCGPWGHILEIRRVPPGY
jgi:hypothetical protein